MRPWLASFARTRWPVFVGQPTGRASPGRRPVLASGACWAVLPRFSPVLAGHGERRKGVAAVSRVDHPTLGEPIGGTADGDRPRTKSTATARSAPGPPTGTGEVVGAASARARVPQRATCAAARQTTPRWRARWFSRFFRRGLRSGNWAHARVCRCPLAPIELGDVVRPTARRALRRRRAGSRTAVPHPRCACECTRR